MSSDQRRLFKHYMSEEKQLSTVSDDTKKLIFAESDPLQKPKGKKSKRPYKKWTPEDDEQLKVLYTAGEQVISITHKMKRSSYSVWHRLNKLGMHVPRRFADVRINKRPWVAGVAYRLRCEEEKRYVGYSEDLPRRIGEHWLSGYCPEGQPPVKWLAKYKPIEVEYLRPGSIAEERKLTLESMEEFGWQNVRGYNMCQVDMDKPPKLFVKYQKEQALLKAKLAPASEQDNPPA